MHYKLAEKKVHYLKERSIYDFNYNVNKDDKILTLSTCYDDDTRVVVHAKLIKVNKK